MPLQAVTLVGFDACNIKQDVSAATCMLVTLLSHLQPAYDMLHPIQHCYANWMFRHLFHMLHSESALQLQKLLQHHHT